MKQANKLEHHHGLNFCWNLKCGIDKNIAYDRLESYALWFYKHHLCTHFQAEENTLFPILGIDHPKIQQALAEHSRLKQLFEKGDKHKDTIELIVKELDHHVKYEENIVFPAIEKLASKQQIKILEDIHKDIEDCDSWTDKFWL